MSVGSVLAEQREKLGLDTKAMATYLRIRLPYLQAIEADEFDDLPPGSAYRIGFIKSYAAALDLDVDQIVAQYHREHGASQNVPLRVRVPLRDSHGSTFGLLGVIAVLLVAGWIGWAYLHHSGDRSIADAVPPVPDRLQPQPPAATAAVTQPESPADADEARDEAYAPAKTAETPATQAAPAATAIHTTESGPSRVEIVVTADTWMQIKNPQTTVYTGVMHAGDTYQIPDQPGWTMTAGNAAGVTLTVDGQPGQAMGEPGVVIRDFSLDVPSASAKNP